jgi:MFS transporter, FSR family, fosmidomycin resistance protein
VAIGSTSTAVVERQMDRLPLGLLSAGHFSVDLSQGAVPAMLPFFIRERHLSYAAAAGLVLAQTITSSVLQLLLGWLTDRRVGVLADACRRGGGSGGPGGSRPATHLRVDLACDGGQRRRCRAYRPEGTRYTTYASGDRRATGMSFFSVGGNAGFAAAPVLATPALLLPGLRGGWLIALVPLAVAAALTVQLRRLDAHRAATTGQQARAPSAASTSGVGPFAHLTGVVLARSVLFHGLRLWAREYTCH